MSKPYGWDKRDYELWSELRRLPSYGLVGNQTDNPLLSRKDVEKLLEDLARERAKKLA